MVHEKTLAAYDKNNFEYELKPHDTAERIFNNWVKQSGRDPKILVNRITRIKTGRDEKGRNEFITWSEKRVGYDHVGNERTFTEDRMGEYPLPIFRSEWDTSTNTIQAVQIERHEKKYEYPFDKRKIDELYDLADETTIKLYVQYGNDRHTIRSFDDFRNGNIDDLIQLGKSDKYYLRELGIETNKEVETKKKEHDLETKKKEVESKRKDKIPVEVSSDEKSSTNE